ncbi:MAG TPA: efflux RND transporter periplasmic adaptor subunit [Stellaceae bacterium]|nr:efflux RND transporter periplasmic adaptor subunit [Stellaceae bacterium]
MWWAIAGSAAKKPVAAGPPPVPVVAAVAVRRNVPQTVAALGTVQSIDTVNVMPQVNGRITRIYFKQGDEVSAGQPLFQIDPAPYEAAANQAKGTLAHDEAAVAEAKVDLARYQQLLSENSIAQQTVADEAATLKQDEGTVNQDAANVATAELNLSYTTVKAPIAGRTGPIEVDLGNYVQAASAAQQAAAAANGTTAAGGAEPLVTITQMHPIYVSFSVPESELDTIRENQMKAPLTAEAFSQAGKLIAAGKLSLISNQVNTATGTIQLEATFPNKREMLWPNLFVTVRLVEFTRRNVVTVPTAAVMTGPAGPYAYMIGSGNKVKRVNLQVSAEEGNITVIGKGLNAGQLVVEQGQYRLTDGVTVSFKPPQAAKPATAPAPSAKPAVASAPRATPPKSGN